jgi:hypothetical protein
MGSRASFACATTKLSINLPDLSRNQIISELIYATAVDEREHGRSEPGGFDALWRLRRSLFCVACLSRKESSLSLYRSISPSHSHSLSLSRSLLLFCSLALSFSRSLLCSLARSLARSLSHTLSPSLSLFLSLSLSLSRAPSLFLSLSFSYSLPLFLTLCLSPRNSPPLDAERGRSDV